VIEEFPMSRDKNGRFTDCGNPKGRPKALKQMEMVAQIRRSEKIAQDSPEDVTDKFLECLRSLKTMLGPGYQLH
jgi:hypothetical protein